MILPMRFISYQRYIDPVESKFGNLIYNTVKLFSDPNYFDNDYSIPDSKINVLFETTIEGPSISYAVDLTFQQKIRKKEIHKENRKPKDEKYQE